MQATGLFEKNSYGNGNMMVYSRLNYFEKNKAQYPHLSIKYVINGTETYAFDQKTFRVTSGKFLLINPGQCYHTHLKSQVDVTGLCINVDTQIIADVNRTMNNRPNYLLDNPSNDLTVPIDVFEDVYHAEHCVLGSLLEQMAAGMQDGRQTLTYGQETYYSLAERILQVQGLVQKNIHRINAKRFTTQKELFRRVQYGKQFIDDSFCSPLQIEDIAVSAAMSPYHFFRTFKQAYQISPHQYIIQKRLARAKEYLQKRQHNIKEIAFLTGFADIHSFSKSFKKAYNLSPSIFSDQTIY
jgi:AraC family transcriptional regulator